MATSTPVLSDSAGTGPLRSIGSYDEFRVQISFTVGLYATAGAVLTLPSGFTRGRRLRRVTVQNPIPDPAVDRIFSWNGSASAPKIGAKVISTGAEVGNGVDLAAVTLFAELVYSG